MSPATDVQRRKALYATLAALRIDPRGPTPRELTLVHRWLDNWNGTGLVLRGMFRHGYAVGISGGPDTGWSVTFLADRPVGGAPDVVSSAHDETPWGAVRVAAWNALDGKPMPGGRLHRSPAPPTRDAPSFEK